MEVDRESPTYRAIKAHLRERLATLGLQLEKDLGVPETAALRGRIGEARDLLAKIDPPVPSEAVQAALLDVSVPY